MAVTLSYTLSDAQAAEVVDALCQRYGYQDTLPDPNNAGQTIPNPETRAQFAKRQVAEFIKHEGLAYRRWLAENSASTADVVIT